MTDERMHYLVDFDAAANRMGPDGYDPMEDRELATVEEANVVSSELVGYSPALHSPALDIDFECRLVPSSTPGHYHLYLDGLTLEWAEYDRLLLALARAGVIEEGYYAASQGRKATFLRLPGVQK